MCYQLSVFFYPKKVPSPSTHELPYMEMVKFILSLDSLGETYQLNHWKELNLRRQPLSLLTSAQSGKRIVSSLKPKDDISMQLKELLTNGMPTALFPNPNKLAIICLSIPISTASAERSFSDVKLINRLCNCLSELSLSNMKIVIESPPKNSLIVIWKKLLTSGIEKVDGLLCKFSFKRFQGGASPAAPRKEDLVNQGLGGLTYTPANMVAWGLTTANNYLSVISPWSNGYVSVHICLACLHILYTYIYTCILYIHILLKAPY